jgi:hypothetical protein
MRIKMKKTGALLLSFLLVMLLSVTAFAGSTVKGNTAYITEGTTTVTSNDIPATLQNRLSITTIYVPNSVTSISAGAFTSFPNLETVYIDNYPGGVKVASGALPRGAKIVYTGEKPTTTRTTTTRKSTTTRTTTTESETESETEEEPATKSTDVVVTKVPTPSDAQKEPEKAGFSVGRAVSIGLVALAGVSAVVLLILKFKKR